MLHIVLNRHPKYVLVDSPNGRAFRRLFGGPRDGIEWRKND